MPAPTLPLRRLSLCALLAVAPYFAAADAPAGDAQVADWAARMERAVALQRDGSERKDEAERVFERADTDCYKRLLVNRCRANVRTEYREEVKQARRIENEGKAIERQVKKEQLNVRDREAEAAAPQRAAELEAREADTAAARSTAAALEAEKRADQARKAEEGTRRKVEEAAQQQKKQAEHEARVAEKKAKAETDAAAKAATSQKQ